MTTPTDHEIICAMCLNGGGFVSRLGEAAHRADPDNLARLKAAFPEYWAKYAAMVPAPTSGSGALCSDEAIAANAQIMEELK